MDKYTASDDEVHLQKLASEHGASAPHRVVTEVGMKELTATLEPPLEAGSR